MIKKTLSMLLALMMIVSVLTVGFVTADAAATSDFTPEASKFYFDLEGAVDANGKPWKELMTNNKGVLTGKIAFYFMGGDFDTEANPTQPLGWGKKALIGTATTGETDIWEMDPVAKLGYQLTEGVQYKIIFVRIDGSNWKEQTCSLYFTTECLGHVAKCDGTMMENDVDSTKKTCSVYWDDSIDPAENGPALCITSIGNVVGSCLEQGKTKHDLLVEFLSKPKEDFSDKTGYENAHTYKCEIDPEAAGYKTEQKLIDDIGEGLGFTKDEVQAAFDEDVVKEYFAGSATGCSWNYDDSVLPSGSHTHTPGEPAIENVTPATCGAAGKHDEIVYCTECGEKVEDLCKYDVVDEPTGNHTAGDPVIENITPATCGVAGKHDEIVYCTVCEQKIEDLCKYDVVDEPTGNHTAGDPVIENITPATCGVAGKHDEIVYCTVCEQKIEDLCKYDVVDEPTGNHTPGDPEITNVVEPGCETAGSHDEIVKCTVCEQQLDEYCHIGVVDPATGHEDPLTYVPEVPATASVDGMQAHYTCTKCGKLFFDQAGSQEATAEELVIKADHVRGDADGNGTFDITDVTALQRKLVDFDVEGFDAIAADADLDGELDVIDVTLMQRVLAGMTTFEAWDAKHAKG